MGTELSEAGKKVKVFEKFTCFGLSNWFTELWSNCLMVMVLVMIIALKSLKKKKRKNITKIGTDYDPNAIVKRSLFSIFRVLFGSYLRGNKYFYKSVYFEKI